jgi:hypothetical protein
MAIEPPWASATIVVVAGETLRSTGGRGVKEGTELEPSDFPQPPAQQKIKARAQKASQRLLVEIKVNLTRIQVNRARIVGVSALVDLISRVSPGRSALKEESTWLGPGRP